MPTRARTSASTGALVTDRLVRVTARKRAAANSCRAAKRKSPLRLARAVATSCQPAV
jgi:hypothetical protein